MKKATHKSERARRVLKWTARALLFSVLLSGAALAAWLAWAGSVLNLEEFRLREIRFQGAQRLSTENVDNLIRTALPGNLLAIDLDRVRALVEGEDWVKSAVARRRLPDRIEIFVTEREPVAVAEIDGDLHVVDETGLALAPFGSDFQNLDRPLVKGLKSLALENAAPDNLTRMRTYLRIIRELDEADPDFARSISEIDVSDPRRVAVVPTREPVPVVLGEDDFARRYRIFLSGLDYYQELKELHGAIESVDVTLDDKIIVHTPDSADPRRVKPQEAS